MPTTNFQIEWDKTGERWYQTGVDHGVLYPMTNSGTYPKGVAWNGLTGVEENPDGGDVTELWADNIKYASFRNPENYGGTIKAYTYPDEWLPCDGQKAHPSLSGMTFQGQTRQPFGLCYRVSVGNDAGADEYQLKLVYNSTVSPSSKSHATKNENPDAEEMSWDYKSTPVNVTGITGISTTCVITLDSRDFTDAQMAAIESVLYGTAAVEADAQNNISAAAAVDARLPLPSEVASIIAAVPTT